MQNIDLELRDFQGMRTIDIVGLLYGYKKIISTGIEESRAGSIKKAFKKYGLLFDVLDEGYDYRKQNCTYIISKESAYVKSALSAYHARRYDIIGFLLGYPECCVRHHYGLISVRDTADDFVRRCHANSANFFWSINNIVDFDGRLSGRKAAGLDLSVVPYRSLISHNPCSYDCKHSLKIAKMNRLILQKHVLHPGPESDYSILAKPVLYADDFNLAILNGASGPAGVEYIGAAYILGFDGLQEKISAGDRIVVRGNGFSVLRNEKNILKKNLPEKPLILPFDRCDAPGISMPKG
ncbi:MAG: hypothetical protein KKH28_04330 [Elusimicrobia bacterium]|nr:hypothetical protein [Elusimicrobiota bacterium]